MKWMAILVVVISAACAGRSWEETPVVADLSPPQPCQSDLAPIWTDSLPIVADTSEQHLVVRGVAVRYPPQLQLQSQSRSRAGLVRARFAVDTAGRVIPGSGIIEAASDQEFARAVCNALPRLTFEPVVRDGHKAVVGFVHVPFTFSAR